MRKKSKSPKKHSISSLARKLGYNERTTRRLVDSGEIPSERNSLGQREVEDTDADKYLAQRQRATA